MMKDQRKSPTRDTPVSFRSVLMKTVQEPFQAFILTNMLILSFPISSAIAVVYPSIVLGWRFLP